MDQPQTALERLLIESLSKLSEQHSAQVTQLLEQLQQFATAQQAQAKLIEDQALIIKSLSIRVEKLTQILSE